MLPFVGGRLFGFVYGRGSLSCPDSVVLGGVGCQKSAKGEAEVRKKAEWSRRFGFASSDGALSPPVLDLGAEKLLDPSR